jgi:hypothetical protein
VARRTGGRAKVDTAFRVAAPALTTLLFLRNPAGRALRLKFIPEKFAFASFVRFQRQRLAVWGYDAFDLSKIGGKRLGFSIVLRLVQESHQITNGVEFRAFLFHRHD